MVTHELKTLIPYWDAVYRGEKTFEVRRDDRGFQKGDRLKLVRWSGSSPAGAILPGSVMPVYDIHAEITYVLGGGQFGIEPGFCVLGIRVLAERTGEGGAA